MCNYIHKEHVAIPKKGKAWKVFIVDNGKLRPLSTSLIHFSETKWYHWDEDEAGDGFCGFLSENEAKKMVNTWVVSIPDDILSIRQIEYQNGLCKQIEDGIIEDMFFTICLFKSFKIIKK